MPQTTDPESTVGRENYPNYDALWPLVSMGVLTADHEPNGWDATAAKRTRVAMIDISVAAEHPCLSGAINRDLALDLGSTRLGAFPYRSPTEPLGDLALAIETRLANGLTHCSALLTELIDRMSATLLPLVGKVKPATAPEFSGHGTAMAGLIGGRPVTVDAFGSGNRISALPLPFSGVDPNCEIVPISTSFDPDPEALCFAFLYAELIQADVVVLARVLPDPHRTMPDLDAETIVGQSLGELVATVHPSAERMELWRELSELIVRTSLVRSVVCAAGNENEELSVYPAHLAADANGIISVSAVNAKGHLAAFSMGSQSTVSAPSSDSEIFNRVETRLDTRHADYSPVGVPLRNNNSMYSSYEVISCDVPGDPGYSASPFKRPPTGGALRDYGSYFCRFGGTSAASALVAGFLSLGYSSGDLRRGADGLEAKSWLLSRCRRLDETQPELLFPVWLGEPCFPDRSVSA